MRAREAGLALALTTQYITSALSLAAGPRTYSSWIQVRDPSSTDRVILGSATAGAMALRWEGSDRSLVLYVVGGSDILATAPATVQPFRWYHVAATHDGVVAKIFVDGALVAWVPDVTIFADAQIRVGSDGTLLWSGRLDDTVIWDKALNAAEIENVVHYGSAAYPASPWLDYRYDDVQATSIADFSGRDNSGTVTGSLTAASWTSATYVSPRFVTRDDQYCLRLNGADEGLQLPGTLTQALDGAPGITLLAWAKPLDMVVTSRRVWSLLSNTGNAAATIRTTPVPPNYYWETFGRSAGADGTEQTQIAGLDGPSIGRWSHVSLTLDFVNKRCEFGNNGLTVVRDIAIAWSRTSWLGSTSGGHIGRAASAEYWNGDLGELLAYRRALTQEERRIGFLTGVWPDDSNVFRLDFSTGELVDTSPYAHVITPHNVTALDNIKARVW